MRNTLYGAFHSSVWQHGTCKRSPSPLPKGEGDRRSAIDVGVDTGGMHRGQRIYKTEYGARGSTVREKKRLLVSGEIYQL